MYSSFQLLKKYLYYVATSSNGKGHGVHSPFVFDFIRKVLNDRSQHEGFALIEARRKDLLRDSRTINVQDFGAGSSTLKHKERQISAIAASSLKSKKYAQVLFRLLRYFDSKVVLELGTSFGITSSYLALANPAAYITTLEGDETIANLARETFQKLDLPNIEVITGAFDRTLSPCLERLSKIDFAFLDGNHQKQSTLNYFEKVLAHSHEKTVIVLDDIHWSEGMEEAWEEIIRSSPVSLSIDLFFVGIVFLNPDFLVPQHFKVRF